MHGSRPCALFRAAPRRLFDSTTFTFHHQERATASNRTALRRHQHRPRQRQISALGVLTCHGRRRRRQQQRQRRQRQPGQKKATRRSLGNMVEAHGRRHGCRGGSAHGAVGCTGRCQLVHPNVSIVRADQAPECRGVLQPQGSTYVHMNGLEDYSLCVHDLAREHV